MQSHQALSEHLFRAALAGADPFETVRGQCAAIRRMVRTLNCQRLTGIGFGKAAVPMALALEMELGDLLGKGIVITKYGHTAPRIPHRFTVLEAGHPVPDENGLRGTEAIAALAAEADGNTMVVTLISGGGSALLVAPAPGISLAAKQQTTDLLRSGADIHQLNTVRKHLSRIKGGQLATLIHPGHSLSLILSDVVGDELDTIASGPNAPDPSTFADAVAVVTDLHLTDKLPPEVMEHLIRGAQGKEPETPKPGSPLFRQVTNRIIASNRTALDAVMAEARRVGIRAEIHATPLTGEACTAGQLLARKALHSKATVSGQPLCLISGGETTVTVRGAGRGGRNMELALSFALEIAGHHGISLLSAGTDGTDGPTDSAGAFVDGNTIHSANRESACRSLKENDSHTFFRKTGGLFTTGPTGTNVMDLQILLIDPEP